jgi:hypothetical protein
LTIGESILVDVASESWESALSWADMTNTDYGGGWRQVGDWVDGCRGDGNYEGDFDGRSNTRERVKRVDSSR